MKISGTDIYMTRGDSEGIIVNLNGYTLQMGTKWILQSDAQAVRQLQIN